MIESTRESITAGPHATVDLPVTKTNPEKVMSCKVDEAYACSDEPSRVSGV